MHSTTICVPERLAKGLYQIKSFIEECARTFAPEPFTVGLGEEKSAGEIWIQGPGTLTPEQYEVLENAVWILNNDRRGDPWKMRVDANDELKRRIDEFDANYRKKDEAADNDGDEVG